MTTTISITRFTDSSGYRYRRLSRDAGHSHHVQCMVSSATNSVVAQRNGAYRAGMVIPQTGAVSQRAVALPRGRRMGCVPR